MPDASTERRTGPTGTGHNARTRPQHAIVALAYHGNAQDANGDDDYDLDVAIVDIDSGDILAHRHEAKGIPSDAASLGHIWLDTACYDLGPGKRAFGVRTENSAHRWQCAFGYTKLLLYLQDGKQLRKRSPQPCRKPSRTTAKTNPPARCRASANSGTTDWPTS